MGQCGFAFSFFYEVGAGERGGGVGTLCRFGFVESEGFRV